MMSVQFTSDVGSSFPVGIVVAAPKRVIGGVPVVVGEFAGFRAVDGRW